MKIKEIKGYKQGYKQGYKVTSVKNTEEGNKAAVKGTWNTGGSEATEDMPRKPLTAAE